MQSLILNTPRLILRPFCEKDASNFYNMNLEEEVMRYTGDVPFASVEEARLFLKKYNQYERFGMGRLTVEAKKTKTYYGWCGLRFDEYTRKVDLGFRIKRDAWGKGIATEAGEACLDWGFNVLGLKKIIARARVENKASIQVLKKLGFEFVKDFEENDFYWRQFKLNR